MIVTLEKNRVVKQAPIGFSWTVFFFGMFVPLLRGDFKGFFIMLFTGWFLHFVFCFLYNGMYVKRLLNKKGYLPACKMSENILKAKGYIV